MVEQATNGFTVTISGESAILSQRQDGEAVPIYHETPEGGRTSVGEVDSQIMLGREMALEQDASAGIIYTDRIKAVEDFKRDLKTDPDGELIVAFLTEIANPNQISSF